MNQKKIGQYIKYLRTEKNLTQEQFAELFGVTNRSVSRWENGVNLPDLDIMLELAEFCNISVETLLDGGNEEDIMDKQMHQQNASETAIRKVADYNNEQNIAFSKRISLLFGLALVALLVYAVLESMGMTASGIGEAVADAALGMVFGMLLVGTFQYTRAFRRACAAKRRLFSGFSRAEK